MYPVTAKYLHAIRYPHRIATRLEVWRGDARVDEAAGFTDGVPFIGGAVRADAVPGVRRELATTLPPAAGLAELLAPIGTELRPWSVLRYPDGSAEEVPLGRFPIMGSVVPIGASGDLRVTAPDLWSTIQRARFLKPRKSTPGQLVRDAIVELVRDVLGAAWPADVTATSTATVGALVWERDRAAEILKLAASIGADVSFDRLGRLVVRDLPTTADRPVWTASTGAGGTITGGARARSRRKTYNVVVAIPKLVDGTPLFAPQIAWDNNPSSPTYAGPNPLTSPELAGPMGVVPTYLPSELYRTPAQALAAAKAHVGRVVGLEQQLGLRNSPNLALDPLDVLDVVIAQGLTLERHVIDGLDYPLDLDTDQTIDTRSTRPDEDAA